MTTAQRTLQQSLATALQAAPALAGVTVDTKNHAPQSLSVSRVVLVLLLSSEELPGVQGKTDWQTTFLVQTGARTTTAQPDAEAAADALLNTVWQILRTLGPTLPDVLELSADPRIEFQADQLDGAYTGASLRITATHRTQPNTLQPWSA